MSGMKDAAEALAELLRIAGKSSHHQFTAEEIAVFTPVERIAYEVGQATEKAMAEHIPTTTPLGFSPQDWRMLATAFRKFADSFDQVAGLHDRILDTSEPSAEEPS